MDWGRYGPPGGQPEFPSSFRWARAHQGVGALPCPVGAHGQVRPRDGPQAARGGGRHEPVPPLERPLFAHWRPSMARRPKPNEPAFDAEGPPRTRATAVQARPGDREHLVVGHPGILHGSPRYFAGSKLLPRSHLRLPWLGLGPFPNASVDGGRRIPMIPPPDRAPSAPRAPHGAPRGPGKHRSPASTERSASNPEAVVPEHGAGVRAAPAG